MILPEIGPHVNKLNAGCKKYLEGHIRAEQFLLYSRLVARRLQLRSFGPHTKRIHGVGVSASEIKPKRLVAHFGVRLLYTGKC